MSGMNNTTRWTNKRAGIPESLRIEALLDSLINVLGIVDFLVAGLLDVVVEFSCSEQHGHPSTLLV